MSTGNLLLLPDHLLDLLLQIGKKKKVSPCYSTFYHCDRIPETIQRRFIWLQVLTVSVCGPLALLSLVLLAMQCFRAAARGSHVTCLPHDGQKQRKDGASVLLSHALGDLSPPRLLLPPETPGSGYQASSKRSGGTLLM